MDEENQDLIGYAFKGKIMISAAVILFLSCFAIVTYHVYTRWCRRRRRISTSPTWPSYATPLGIDRHVVNSLPTLAYRSGNQESPAECAVCLSELEDGEIGRILPDCNHCFHVDCIDMWLQSHRDCPLCRTRVRTRPVPNQDFTVVSIHVPEGPATASGTPSSSSSSGAPDPHEILSPALKIRIQDPVN